jgi:hypothetical protein
MRIKDYFQMISISVALGLIFSVIGYFIWSDFYKTTTNSFWYSMILLGLLSLPIGYWSAKKNSSCAGCGKPFVISHNGQTDLEHYVKYKNESVTENGVTRNRDVPYNVRRYIQHLKCDACGFESQYQTSDESKA